MYSGYSRYRGPKTERDTLAPLPQDYESAKEMMNGQLSVSSRGRNTDLHKHSLGYSVELHGQQIVTFTTDGNVVLNRNGSEASAWKTRVNLCLKSYEVFFSGGRPFVRLKDGSFQWPFKDEMKMPVVPDGESPDWRPTETVPEDHYAL